MVSLIFLWGLCGYVWVSILTLSTSIVNGWFFKVICTLIKPNPKYPSQKSIVSYLLTILQYISDPLPLQLQERRTSDCKKGGRDWVFFFRICSVVNSQLLISQWSIYNSFMNNQQSVCNNFPTRLQRVYISQKYGIFSSGLPNILVLLCSCCSCMLVVRRNVTEV